MPLAEQDRGLWDRGMIAEGAALVQAALARGRVGRFQIQAAVAALHGEAETAEATDWPQIVALYRLMLRIDPSPVVQLNFAVALAETAGPEAALEEMSGLEAALDTYQPFHAARAALLAHAGAPQLAVAAYDRALALTRVGSEIAFLKARRALALAALEGVATRG